MTIENLTPRSSIEGYVQKQIDNAKNAIIYRLFVIGEQVVNHARSLPSPSAEAFKGKPHQPNYIDWTANLRSSIGYVVVLDGKVVRESSFAPVSGGSEGSKQGKDFAYGLSSRIPNGIGLIVVAGMNYAQYVSSKGYDVIDSSEVLAQKLVPDMLRQLGFLK